MGEKSDWIKERIKEIQGLQQYSVSGGSAELLKKIDSTNVVKLDANENFFIPRPLLSQVFEQISREVDLRLYPQREEEMLLEELEDYINFPSSQIVLGNGSDQIIELTVKAFLKASEETISVKPTFSMYRIYVDNQRAKYNEVALNDDFSLNVNALLSRTNLNAKICFLCSPNNPTANQFKTDDVRKIIEEFRGIVVLDEAYVEFAPSSLVKLVDMYDNLIVLRTFSKVFGLAGLRIGYAISNPTLSKVLLKIQPPYNINSVSLRMALGMLHERKIVVDAIQKMKEERERLIGELNGVKGIKAFNSAANFVLLKIDSSSDAIYEKLVERKILIKNIGTILGRKGYMRVTVGLPEMSKKLVDALKEILQ